MGIFDSIKRKLGYDINNRNGVNEKYWSNGMLHKKYYTKDGKLHGKYSEYIGRKEENWITTEINYRNGIKDGPAKYYWDNKISAEAIFKEGKVVEVIKETHFSGNQVITDINKGFYKMISLSKGKEDQLLEMSKIKGVKFTKGSNSSYSGNRGGVYPIKNGLSEKWYENGKIKEEGTWKDSEYPGDIYSLCFRVDEHIFYHNNGKVFKKGNWKNGKLDGMHQIFYPDGNIEFEIVYSDGRIVKEDWFNTDGSKMDAQQIIEKGGIDPRKSSRSGGTILWAHDKLNRRENIIINDLKFSRNPAEHYSLGMNMQDHANLGHSYEEI